MWREEKIWSLNKTKQVNQKMWIEHTKIATELWIIKRRERMGKCECKMLSYLHWSWNRNAINRLRPCDSSTKGHKTRYISHATFPSCAQSWPMREPQRPKPSSVTAIHLLQSPCLQLLWSFGANNMGEERMTDPKWILHDRNLPKRSPWNTPIVTMSHVPSRRIDRF